MLEIISQENKEKARNLIKFKLSLGLDKKEIISQTAVESNLPENMVKEFYESQEKSSEEINKIIKINTEAIKNEFDNPIQIREALKNKLLSNALLISRFMANGFNNPAISRAILETSKSINVLHQTFFSDELDEDNSNELIDIENRD